MSVRRTVKKQQALADREGGGRYKNRVKNKPNLTDFWLRREFCPDRAVFNADSDGESREKLRRDVEARIAQLDRGEGLDEDEVFEELEREIGEIEQRRDA